MRRTVFATSFILLANAAAFAQQVGPHQKGDLGKPVGISGKPKRLNPEHAASFYKRGLARHKRGDFDQAIEDFDQAIRFDPNHASAYSARGVAWQSKGDIEKAITDFDEAIRLDPSQATYYGHRGNAWSIRGKYDKAQTDWNDAIRLDPKNLQAHCALAWLLATCPDGKYRNGNRAVAMATNACELSNWQKAYSVGALAAAYAECGDFANAVKWQEEFLRLCPEGERKKWGYLLELYKSGKSFREPRQEFRFGGDVRHSTNRVA